MISTPAIESSSVGFIYLIENGIIPFEVFTMINNFIFHLLEQILNNPCEFEELKRKWLFSIHKEIGHNYDKILDDIFLDIINSSFKYNWTVNDSHENKLLISITLKGIQEYADYLNQIYIPNSNMSIASQSNEIARESNELSKAANKKSSHANCISFIAVLFTLAGLIISIIALLK